MTITSIRNKAALIASIGRGLRPKYVFFWGHTPAHPGSIDKSCFSQWFGAPFTVDGDHYPTAEHFMMAEKARLFDDEATRRKILAASSPAQAKKLGREVKGFSDGAWVDARFEIVVRASLAKFSQNPAMGAFLGQTGDRILVEASPPDAIWGIGMAANHEHVEQPQRWPGLNLLGFALMEARDRLRSAA